MQTLNFRIRTFEYFRLFNKSFWTTPTNSTTRQLQSIVIFAFPSSNRPLINPSLFVWRWRVQTIFSKNNKRLLRNFHADGRFLATHILCAFRLKSNRCQKSQWNWKFCRWILSWLVSIESASWVINRVQPQQQLRHLKLIKISLTKRLYMLASCSSFFASVSWKRCRVTVGNW